MNSKIKKESYFIIFVLVDKSKCLIRSFFNYRYDIETLITGMIKKLVPRATGLKPSELRHVDEVKICGRG